RRSARSATAAAAARRRRAPTARTAARAGAARRTHFGGHAQVTVSQGLRWRRPQQRGAGQASLLLLEMLGVAAQARAVLRQLQLGGAGLLHQRVVAVTGLLADEEDDLFLLLGLGHGYLVPGRAAVPGATRYGSRGRAEQSSEAK